MEKKTSYEAMNDIRERNIKVYSDNRIAFIDELQNLKEPGPVKD